MASSLVGGLTLKLKKDNFLLSKISVEELLHFPFELL